MRSSKIVFFDKDTSIDTKEKLVLILSPAFYWFHKEKLDIPLSQAKKIAASVFEGIIPPGEYSYFVQKVGDEYHFYAYEDGKILEAFHSQGVKPSQIKKVYAAQMVFQELKEPVALGDKVVVNEDGVVVVLPKKMVGFEVKKTDLNSLKLPKTSLPLKAYAGSIIPEEQVYTLSVLLFIAILLYGVQAFVHKRAAFALSAKEMAIKERYHLPPTTLQLKSILASLEKVQKEQLDLREKIEYILRMPLRPTEYIQKLDFSQKIRFEVVLGSAKRAEEIKNYLAKKLRLKDLTLSGNKLLVEAAR